MSGGAQSPIWRPQDYSSRVAYRPPADWYRRINRLGVLLTSLGLAPRDAVTLEVRGRRSGQPRRTPILRTSYQEEDYLVALAGESEWVRNVRAAAGRAVIRRRGGHRVRLVELPPEERPAVIAEYLRRGVQRSGSRAAAQQARFYFGMNPDPSLEEIRAAAKYYPVFRVAYEDSPAPTS
jgi:deazaflavin-dependent oxidoreductase (nitroreductase family)